MKMLLTTTVEDVERFLDLEQHFDRIEGVGRGYDVHFLDLESLGRAFTYLASGRPLVATRLVGIPEVVVDGKNGLLVEEKSPQQLADAIIQLLASPTLAERYGAENRLEAERDLTWNSVAKSMVQVYEQAIAIRN